MNKRRRAAVAPILRNLVQSFRVSHPFFFAVYPAIHLYAENANEIEPVEFLTAALILLGLAGAILWLLGLVVRDVERAAALVTLCIIPMLYYGYAFDLTEWLMYELGVAWAPRSLVVLPIWCLPFAVALVVVSDGEGACVHSHAS